MNRERLNIQRFSGGSYDYLYLQLDITTYDEELGWNNGKL